METTGIEGGKKESEEERWFCGAIFFAGGSCSKGRENAGVLDFKCWFGWSIDGLGFSFRVSVCVVTLAEVF